jgi:hypothetical protein
VFVSIQNKNSAHGIVGTKQPTMCVAFSVSSGSCTQRALNFA